MTLPAARTAEHHLDRPLALYPLTYLEDGDEVTVGCSTTNSYAVLPADGAALIRQLADGKTPHQAAAWYERTYGEKVDLVEFLDALTELEFLRDPEQAAEDARPIRWQRLARLLFGPVAGVCYAAVLVAAVVAMIAVPAVRPGYQNLFFTRYVTVIELTLFVGQIVGLLIHECAHALAGRRLGLRSTLRIGWRLYFLVFETRLDGLVCVPPRRRYLPLLAGMLADALVVATLTLVAVASRGPDGHLPLLGGICLALAFSTLLRLVWQFYFYLQTDLYYLAVTVLGCVDLQTTAKRLLHNRFWRLLRRPDRLVDESTWHPRDRAVARWYSWLLLAGYTFLVATLALVALPSLWRVGGMMLDRLVVGGRSWTEITDGAVFLALNLANFALIAGMAIRARWARRHQPQLSHVLD